MFFFILDACFKFQCLLLNDLPEASLCFLCCPNPDVWESSGTKVSRSAGVSNLVMLRPFGVYPGSALGKCTLLTANLIWPV